VRADIAARKNIFQMLEELNINGHHVFKVAMERAILHHQDLAVALHNGGFDFAGFFVEQDFMRQFAVDNLLPDFRNALGAQRIRGARPA
jgi:hypothetical protein